MDEQRKYTRAAVSLPVRFVHGESSQTARALNLSANGMLIETRTPPFLDEKIRVAFKLPEDGKTIEAEGEVVWVNKYCVNYPYGMAIKFTNLKAEFVQAIDAYVRKVRESSKGGKREDIVAIPD